MAQVQTTLSGAITSTQTTFGVASATNITNPNFQTGAGITFLDCDQELMLVLSISGTVVTVVRGYNGTPAQAHVSGQLITSGLPSDFATFSTTLNNPSEFTQLLIGSMNWNGINLTGSADAINPAVAQLYIVKTAGVDSMTLAAPPASAEGNIIGVISDTTNAHTITATSLLANGTALKTTATFAAFRGAGIFLRACNGVWQQIMNTAVTLT